MTSDEEQKKSGLLSPKKRRQAGTDTYLQIHNCREASRHFFMSNLDRTSGNGIQSGKRDLGQWVAQEDCKIFVTGF